MEVISDCNLPVASLLWRPTPGAWALTVVCKASYMLVPGTARLAHYHEQINEEDSYWDDEPARSLFAPCDIVPSKVNADVLVVGSVFAAGTVPVRSVCARLVVDSIDKSMEVHGDRSWSNSGTLREAIPFRKIPLRYERAAAGAGNPVGLRPRAADASGTVYAPNFLRPGTRALSQSDPIEPIGFGPVAPTWPDRIKRLSPAAARWTDPAAWRADPMPEDFDIAYFNAAPPDQQVHVLHSNEKILLEYLHPEHTRLETCLPGCSPRAHLEYGDAGDLEIPLVADTLWIDTERSICALTWRGRMAISDASRHGRVVVRMDDTQAKSHQSRQRVETALLSGELSAAEHSPLFDGSAENENWVGAPAAPRSLVGAETIRPVASSRPVLPFVQPSEGAGVPMPLSWDQDPLPGPSRQPGATETQWLSPDMVAAAAVLPFSAGAPHRNSEPYASDPLRDWAAADVIPPSVIGFPASRDTTGIDEFGAAPNPEAISISPHESPAESEHKPAGKPQILSLAAKRRKEAAAVMGAAAASDAAAAKPPRDNSPSIPSPETSLNAPVPAHRRPPRDTAIQLLWFDPAFAEQVRSHPRWKEIIANLKPKPRDADYGGDASSSRQHQDVKLRRDIAGILSLGTPEDWDGVDAALGDAIDEDGVFLPPLVLVAGELCFPFDEIELLKAMVAVVAPLVGDDKTLKQAVDAANELLRTPVLQSSSSMAESLLAKIRESVASKRRSAAADYLEAHVERVLLEQRHYQKRTLLGQSFIRGQLVMTGNQPLIPTYLPLNLSRELPMFQRIRARIIAEARMQADQYEAHAFAFRALALGHVIQYKRS